MSEFIKKTNTIALRLTASEEETMRVICADRKMTIGAFVRGMIQEELEKYWVYSKMGEKQARLFDMED